MKTSLEDPKGNVKQAETTLAPLKKGQRELPSVRKRNKRRKGTGSKRLLKPDQHGGVDLGEVERDGKQVI